MYPISAVPEEPRRGVCVEGQKRGSIEWRQQG